MLEIIVFHMAFLLRTFGYLKPGAEMAAYRNWRVAA